MSERASSEGPDGKAAPIDPFDQEDFSAFMGSMAGEAKAYWSAQKDYYAFVASERAAKASVDVFGSVLLALIGTAVLGFLSLAGAIALGQWLNSMALGFLVMAGVLLAIGAIGLLLWRNGLRNDFRLRIFNAIYHD